ncbi:MAG TPA: putative holin-like toxin [Desulfobacteria bacterium]|nr:putative holin-like toxin [Desulfobacteria bacterium]
MTMAVYEALSLMIAFAALVVSIIVVTKGKQ